MLSTAQGYLNGAFGGGGVGGGGGGVYSVSAWLWNLFSLECKM